MKELTLVHDGKSDYSIVVSAKAPPAEQRGAKELQQHLKLISGAELLIVTDAKELPSRAILVGRSAATEKLGVKIDADLLGNEGFLIQTAGERLVIAGSEQRGTMYGCTTFLEKLGVRWFTPTVTRAPKTKTV